MTSEVGAQPKLAAVAAEPQTPETTERYDPQAIERKWQLVWEAESTWVVANPGSPEFDESKPKSYVLEMLPYPSGEPHVGHLKTYSVGDAIAHFRRRRGFSVVHPMGYDAFGLPAENNAINTGEHPREATEKSIASFREQFMRWGISIDWTREIGTHEPAYYRWTQWIFLKLFEKGLAHRHEAPVQWCPKDQTVLANEQVIDGRCERCGTLVEQRNLEQWFFRITEYAQQLLDDFDLLESWPENVVTMQRNWIGRSEGAEVVFRCEDIDLDFPVFTTRPDTLFGATFFVLAPEHPLVERLAAGTEHEQAVRDYVNESARATVEERADEERQKTGVPLGREVVNPVNGERIPMFVADYVLMEYGTGAIMAVPAHDERDYEFAKAFDLPIRRVIEGTDPEQAKDEGLPYSGDGTMVNSGRFDGKHNREAYDEIIELAGVGGPRQAGGQLPPPRLAGLAPALLGGPDTDPLLRRVRDGARSRGPAAGAAPGDRGVRAQGPQPAGGGRGLGQHRMPEVRGEGAPRDGHDGHLRGFLLVLPALPRSAQRRGVLGPRRRRLLDADRPVHRRCRARDPPSDVRALLRQGAARHESARGARAVREPLHAGDDHPRRGEDVQVPRQHGEPGRVRGALRGRHPADLHLLHGAADQGRRLVRRGSGGHLPVPLAALAAGPRGGRCGPRRAAPRTGRPAMARALLAKAHWAIDKVTRDIDPRFQFNTAISAVMELVNEIYRLKDGLYDDPVGAAAVRFATSTAVSLLFPFAPHLCSEVYEWLEGERVWEQPWPEADPQLLERDTYMLVVQVNGKLRDRIEVGSDTAQEELLELARSSENVQRHLDGKAVAKEIVVPGRLVNFVVKG